MSNDVREFDEAAETDRERQLRSQQKTRRCLLCGKPFESAWFGERICRRCKSSSSWRTG